MPKSLIKPLLLTCLAVCGAHAKADTVTFNGFVNGSMGTNITVGAYNLSAPMGGFSTSLNGGPSFTTYCVDVYQFLTFGPTYTDYTQVAGNVYAFANPNANQDLGRLFSENQTVNSPLTQAAFQIALLEIAFETSGSYNVNSGQATFTSAASALANSWLAALPGQSNYNITVLHSDNRQDVLFATPVPEPDSLALMIAGLLGLGIVSRRRQTKA